MTSQSTRSLTAATPANKVQKSNPHLTPTLMYNKACHSHAVRTAHASSSPQKPAGYTSYAGPNNTRVVHTVSDCRQAALTAAIRCNGSKSNGRSTCSRALTTHLRRFCKRSTGGVLLARSPAPFLKGKSFQQRHSPPRGFLRERRKV
jgi:hypothetical protein